MSAADRTAVILGASGSVGEALVDEVARCGSFSRIVVLARRPLGLQRKTPARIPVHEQLVPDMTPENLRLAVVDALRDIEGEVSGFSVLGVGAGTARLSLEEHRAVDVDLNAAFALGLKESGKVRYLAFMSAVGADLEASATGSGAAGMARYARVKGESEAAVRSQGPAVVGIFRPATIIGSRHTPRLVAALLSPLARLLPARFHSIRTTEIARAMVASALHPPAQGTIFSYPEMMALIAGR